MKNKFFKTISAIISGCILFSSLMSTVSAEFDPSDPHSIPTTREEIDEYKQYLLDEKDDIFVKPLDDESLVKAEEFILANDRAGLYDFLMDYNGYNEYRDGWLVYWATQYTGQYITNDNGAYGMVLFHYVFSHYDNGAPLAPELPTAGDINFDGNVSLFDIIMINKMSVGAV
ncbi:MAG: hypothetical protein K2H01_09680, partial [Ruminococcus sp.]|nr:hypothetical protein [Ruminococcus sp.]